MIYLGSFLPPQPLAANHGWEPADMPAGVPCEPAEADVLVVSETTDTDDPVGYASTVWLPRIYRPMERLQLRLTSVFDPEVVVDARVLEVTAIRFQDNPGGTPSVVVAVDDLQPAADAGGNGSPGWVFVTGRGCNPTP